MPASRGQQDDAGHVHAGFDASETSSTKQGHRSDWTLGDPRRRHVSCKCLIVKDGRVAQLVEQCPFKAWVAGSNPAALTKLLKDLAGAGNCLFHSPQTVHGKLSPLKAALPG